MATNISPIAIVGIAVELPSGTYAEKNLARDAFTQFLLEKGESYETIPTERFNADALQGKALGRILPKKGSFLKSLDLFDHAEFNVTATDAQHMAVATRKLIESTFLALLDSGIDYRGRNVGCYMAGVSHDLWMLGGQDEYEAPGSFANAPGMVANRVSYYLDLRGPSVPIDTACSSSLTALHLAAQSIRAGECESAVVGGCQTNLRVADWINYSQGGIVNVDGKCKPFDSHADGFGRGEGCVSVVLKPLDAALRDGDKIYGLIRGSAINSTGSLAPVSAPVASTQQAAMEAALRQARLSPQDVDFLELHATGTSRGDPTEANWVGPLFQRDGDILIGSVKGNIGHLEIAAFLASLSKVLSIFETGLIPPTVNLTTPNPAIKWDEYRLRAPTEVMPLLKRNHRAIVAMTSSGIGGANGSCIVEGPPTPPTRSPGVEFWASNASSRPHLFVSGGLSPRTAVAVAEALQQQREAGVDETALTLTYGRRVRSMPWINYAVMSSDEPASFSEPALAPKSPGSLVFVFSGQGPQHIAMGRELFRTSNVFRESVLELDAIYERTTAHSLIRKYGLFDDSVQPEILLEDIWPIAVTLPALTILQVALLDTLRFLGLKPDIVIGHSAGETAVLYASGTAPKELTIELSIARGRGMSPLESLDCSMAAVNCTEAEAKEIIAEVASELGPGSLEIGCYNSTDALTLSGANAHLDHAVEIATARGIFARKLKTRVAVHSSMMEHCRDTYFGAVNEAFARHQLASPTTTVYSSATGDVMEGGGDAEYFWANSRGPVRFAQAVQALTKAHPNACFLEIGPHPVLSSYLSILAGDGAVVACPLRRLNPKKSEKDVELRTFLGALGQLSTARHHVNYSLLAGPSAQILRRTPAYPFKPKSVPVWFLTPEVKQFTRPRNGPLNFDGLRINAQTHPSLADHRIKSTAIMPAAGYMEMALEFGARRLWNVKFISMLGLTSARPTAVQVDLNDGGWAVKSISSRVDDLNDQFDRHHADGLLSTDIADEDKLPAPLEVEGIRARCQSFDVVQFYDDIKHFADYGPDYRRITALALNDDEAFAEVRASTTPNDPIYVIHPAVLDAALHAVIHPAMTGNRDRQLYYLPATVRSVTIHDALLENMPEKIVSHIVRRRWTPLFIEFDITIATMDGVRLCTLESLGIQQHGASISDPPSERYELLYVPAPLPSLVDHRDSSFPDPIAPIITLPAFTHIIKYERGEEMLIQSQLGRYNTWDPEAFWFVAMSDDQGAFGFTRSLRREYASWNIKLVVFDASWLEPERDRALKPLINMEEDLEDELFIDTEGCVAFPRLSALKAPHEDVAFDPSRSWVFQNADLMHVDCPQRTDSDGTRIVIEVLAVSEGKAGLREFIGRDADSKRMFMGITDGLLSNFVLTSREACVEVPEGMAKAKTVPPLLAIAIASLALGPGAFHKPRRVLSRLRDLPVIITHDDEPIGRTLCELFTALGISFTSLSASCDLSRLPAGDSPLILSGYEDGAQNRALAAALRENGQFFGWADQATGLLISIRKTPWLFGDAIQDALEAGLTPKLTPVTMKPALAFVQNAPSLGKSVPCVASLFNGEKAYVLVGGCGSLGADVAYWMYENGARHLILTSRSGRASLIERADKKTLRMLDYLETLPELNLRVLAVDATSTEAMSAMLKDTKRSIGGCMLMAVTLIDRLFSRQDAASFDAVFAPKVGAMEALQRCLDVSSLDWLVSFSSVSAFFGNAGQTSYASANTALDGMLQHLPNAFSIVVPAILDSSVAVERDHAQLRHLTAFGITSRELCACIGDAIRLLAQGPLSIYVPDLNWNTVNKTMGPSPVFQHLVTADTQLAEKEGNHSIEDIVIQHLDIQPEDFSPEVPLTAYGLDSLSAARLSNALRSFVPISQLQLLDSTTLQDIMRRAETAEGVPTSPSLGVYSAFDWKDLHTAGHTVVKALDSNDPSAIPLILLHGGTGSIEMFGTLVDIFTTPLWLLQTTPDMPTTSVEDLALFYVQRVKADRPHGPYRVASFCISSVIAVEMVRVFEAGGDDVLQFVFIDHVPTLWDRPKFAPTPELLVTGLVDESVLRGAFHIVLDGLDLNAAGEAQFHVEFTAAWESRDEKHHQWVQVHYFRRLVSMVYDYLLSLAPEQRQDPAAFKVAMRQALCQRVRGIAAPVTVWVADRGLIVDMEEDLSNWTDMGITPDAVFHCPGSHGQAFFQPELTSALEFGWSL